MNEIREEQNVKLDKIIQVLHLEIEDESIPIAIPIINQLIDIRGTLEEVKEG